MIVRREIEGSHAYLTTGDRGDSPCLRSRGCHEAGRPVGTAVRDAGTCRGKRDVAHAKRVEHDAIEPTTAWDTGLLPRSACILLAKTLRIRMRLHLRGSRPSRDFRGAAAVQPVDDGRPLRGRML